MTTENGDSLLPMTSPLVKAELVRLNSEAAPEMPGSLRKLLKYLVRKADEGAMLDDRMIAKEVFGRGEDFDTAADPIVRIQLGRLRRRLEDYYLSSSQPVRIFIEKGSQTLSARLS